MMATEQSRVLHMVGLSHGAKILWFALAAEAGTGKTVAIGHDALAQAIGRSKRSVASYLDELSAARLISQQRRGLGLPNVYSLEGGTQ
jgi:hypothetical protein